MHSPPPAHDTKKPSVPNPTHGLTSQFRAQSLDILAKCREINEATPKPQRKNDMVKPHRHKVSNIAFQPLRNVKTEHYPNVELPTPEEYKQTHHEADEPRTKSAHGK